MTPPDLPRIEPDVRRRPSSPIGWILSPGSKRFRYAIAGIVLPLVCLYYDPFVFRTPPGANFASSCYILIGSCMIAFSIRLTLARGGPFLAGAIAAGAAFAGLLAVMLLPVVLLVIVEVRPVGLMEIFMLAVAMLGTAPALVAYVYFQVARAIWLKVNDPPRSRAQLAAVAGFLSVLAVAGLAQWSIQAEFARVIRMASEGGPIGATELAAVRLLAWGDQADVIVERYTAEGDPSKRERLATLYRLISRQDIELRIKQRGD